MNRKDREIVTRITHEELVSLSGCIERIKTGRKNQKSSIKVKMSSRKEHQEPEGENSREQRSSLHIVQHAL